MAADQRLHSLDTLWVDGVENFDEIALSGTVTEILCFVKKFGFLIAFLRYPVGRKFRVSTKSLYPHG